MTHGGSTVDVPRSRGRRVGIIVGVTMASLLVLAAAGAITWHTVARGAIGGLTIAQDARPWICTHGTTVVAPTSSDTSSEPQYLSLAAVSKDMDCRLRVVVRNTSSHTVTVDAARFGMFGQGTGVNITGVQLDGDFTTARASGARDDTDARFLIPNGLNIEPDSWEVLLMKVVYSDKGRGCSFTPGSTESGFDVTLHAQSLGPTGTVTGDIPWAGLTGPKTGCN